MRISLRPELEQFIQQKVSGGQYASSDDVVNGALELLRAQETLTPQDVEELREELHKAVQQADRGDYVQFDSASIKAEGRARLNRGQR